MNTFELKIIKAKKAYKYFLRRKTKILAFKNTVSVPIIQYAYVEIMLIVFLSSNKLITITFF